MYNKLEKAIRLQAKTDLQRFIEEIRVQSSVETILGSWYYRELITKSKQGKKWELPELIAYLIERKTKKDNLALDEKLNRLKYISEAGELISANISIEWKKSRMWGSNPTATGRIQTSTGYFTFESGSIGGCGYDKQSTAVAQVMNQCNAFLNMLYKVKETKPKTENRELFGYGSGYGILPNLEGGVGVSCYPKIFNKIGMNFETVASGKTFDVYSITKK